ncbi:DIP1984 family protein [Jidongwangia harbinensis]|uniref:DIP1984 family protein n=1 Tax=Jidongwangia harbinensis TaxID=2878561 RepID=UPI003557CDB4
MQWSPRPHSPEMGGVVDRCPPSCRPGNFAEALALRADAARRAERLRSRITGSARHQEGEAPAEDTATGDAGAGVRLPGTHRTPTTAHW